MYKIVIYNVQKKTNNSFFLNCLSHWLITTFTFRGQIGPEVCSQFLLYSNEFLLTKYRPHWPNNALRKYFYDKYFSQKMPSDFVNYVQP